MRNMNDWIKSIMAPRRVALPILTTPGIALVKADPQEAFQSGSLQAEIIRRLAEALPSMAAALTMMDLSVEAEAFGSPVKFGHDENPTVSAAIVSDKSEIDDLAIPAMGTARTKENLLTARLCASAISDRPTFGGMIGPFSLTGRLLDMSKMMLLTAMEPETIHALLEKTTQFLINYALAFKETGCNGVIIAEPAAGLVSPSMCASFSSQYIQRIVERVQDDHFLVILHNCGKTEKMVSSMLSTGAKAIHVGNTVDVRVILDQTPETIPVMGNIDPSGVFLMGTAEEVREKTLQLLEATKGYPHFVLSSGCDVPMGTPMANIHVFFEALSQYNER